MNPGSLKAIQALLPAEIDYNNEKKKQAVLFSNKDILMSQNRHSFFATAKENKRDNDVLHNQPLLRIAK
ncbi:hypothetical protein Lsan_0352 [Legionella santicrucis]|uniref:Uncharacterized protein n=1 Tax=Legionella santicrucis TaxID=45074 RepID=A0A0W0ZEI7_9GAMM|nr:hypothetical protein Lsan_0352 [Legionella santicrucis]